MDNLPSPVQPPLSSVGRAVLTLTLSVTLLGVAGSSQAATVCVNPGGTGGCLSSVQAAVTAAAAGDTVKVAPGTYFEAVTISTSGLILRGTGATPQKVIIDNGPPTSSADGIAVEANNVTIKNLSVRNSPEKGIKIDDGVTGTTIDGVEVRNASREGINTEDGNDNTTIEDSVVRGTGSGDTCIKISSGNNTIIQRNIASECEGEGIHVEGDDAVVFKNQVQATRQDGINVNGDGMSVKNNSVTQSLGNGFFISCDSCAGGEIKSNSANENLGEGFSICGASNITFTRNTANDNLKSGFVVACSSASNTLSQNKANTNNAEGFEVQSSVTNTTITKNKASGNRTDFCDSGSGTAASGNTFGTSNDAHCLTTDPGGDD